MNKQFLAIFLLSALLGSYATPDSGPEDEFEWPVTELTQEENTDFVSIFAQEGSSTEDLNKLQAAIGKLSTTTTGKNARKLSNLLAAKSHKTHDQKLKDTIAKKSDLKKLVDGIQKTLKNEYADHKKSAEAALSTLSSHKNGLLKSQFRPLVAGAKNWCVAWKEQQRERGILAAKEKTMKAKKAANIPSPKEWQKACEWGVSYSKTNKNYSDKPFSATSAFQTQFDTARKAYWESSKAHFEQNTAHKSDITSANTAATAFKTSIDSLADYEVTGCGTRDRKAQKDIVTGFNSANVKRAAVYRSLKVIQCHITHLDSKTVKSSTDTCTATVKSETHYHTTLFKDLTVPDITCPTKAQVLKNIKDKYPKLNFHFKGEKTQLATGPSGNLKADQGWVPSTDSCKKVSDHHIKGSQCKDYASDCPSGKTYDSSKATVYITKKAEAPAKCCKTADCINYIGATRGSCVSAVVTKNAKNEMMTWCNKQGKDGAGGTGYDCKTTAMENSMPRQSLTLQPGEKFVNIAMYDFNQWWKSSNTNKKKQWGNEKFQCNGPSPMFTNGYGYAGVQFKVTTSTGRTLSVGHTATHKIWEISDSSGICNIHGIIASASSTPVNTGIMKQGAKA